MSILMQLLSNKILLSACLGWFLAQGAKVVLELFKGEFSLKRLMGSGGMPSSHSATVIGLALSAAITEGLSSSTFALAQFLAFIVIYDARGVRYETGRQAGILNKMHLRDLKNGKEPLLEKELDEKMGHTVSEILVGMAVGVLAALIVCV